LSKLFDMRPAGKIVYYPDFEGLPFPKESKLTPETLKNTIDKAATGKHPDMRGEGWCAWFTQEHCFEAEGVYFKTMAPYCHARLDSVVQKSFYLDLINWRKLSAKQKEGAKEIYKMLVSVDSPWADALKNAYLIFDKEEDRLLGVYVEELGRDVPKGVRLLFCNAMIALRVVSEHRNVRDYWVQKRETNTILGHFVLASVSAGYWHNWYPNNFSEDVFRSVLLKEHDTKNYYGNDRFSAICNYIFGKEKEKTPKVGLDTILKVEKELKYA